MTTVEVETFRMATEHDRQLDKTRHQQALERFHRFQGNEAAGMHDHWSDAFRQWVKPQHPDEPDEEYENRRSTLTIDEALLELRQACRIKR